MKEIRLGKDNFKDEVTNHSGFVLVDFWAGWCGPCMMVAPVIAQIAEENSDIKVGKVNVDEEPELAQVFNIQSIPAIILFKDGKPVKQSIGYVPKEKIEAMFK